MGPVEKPAMSSIRSGADNKTQPLILVRGVIFSRLRNSLQREPRGERSSGSGTEVMKSFADMARAAHGGGALEAMDQVAAKSKQT